VENLKLETGQFVIRDKTTGDLWLDNMEETFKSREEAEDFAECFFEKDNCEVRELKFFFLP